MRFEVAGRASSHAQTVAKPDVHFEEAIELYPNGSHIPAVKRSLAMALRKEKRAAEALVLAQQVADQTTDSALQPDGWWLVALCARDLGDLDTAQDTSSHPARGSSRGNDANDPTAFVFGAVEMTLQDDVHGDIMETVAGKALGIGHGPCLGHDDVGRKVEPPSVGGVHEFP